MSSQAKCESAQDHRDQAGGAPPRYTGSCHCGSVRYQVDTEITRVIDCNCSICRKKGVLSLRVKPEQFRLLSGEDQLGTYRFGTGLARHHFCTVCGIHTFSRPRAAPDQYTINVRTIDEPALDLDALERVPFDGLHWEQSVAALHAMMGDAQPPSSEPPALAD